MTEKIQREEKTVRFDDSLYYEDEEDQEYAEQEYQDQMAEIIDTATRNDQIVSDAIDLYLDHDFYPDIFRPHITVWIQWYRTKYLEVEYYCFDDMEKDLADLEIKFNKMIKKREHKRLVNKIYKRS